MQVAVPRLPKGYGDLLEQVSHLKSLQSTARRALKKLKKPAATIAVPFVDLYGSPFDLSLRPERSTSFVVAQLQKNVPVEMRPHVSFAIEGDQKLNRPDVVIKTDGPESKPFADCLLLSSLPADQALDVEFITKTLLRGAAAASEAPAPAAATNGEATESASAPESKEQPPVATIYAFIPLTITAIKAGTTAPYGKGVYVLHARGLDTIAAVKQKLNTTFGPNNGFEIEVKGLKLNDQQSVLSTRLWSHKILASVKEKVFEIIVNATKDFDGVVECKLQVSPLTRAIEVMQKVGETLKVNMALVEVRTAAGVKLSHLDCLNATEGQAFTATYISPPVRAPVSAAPASPPVFGPVPPPTSKAAVPASADGPTPAKKPRDVLIIATLTGKKLEIPYKENMTIEQLKQAVRDQEGIPEDQQRLVFAGKQLEDNRTVGNYGIPREGCLHLVLRLRGGMYHWTSGRLGFDFIGAHSEEATEHVSAVCGFVIPKELHVSSVKEISETADPRPFQVFLLNSHRVLAELYADVKNHALTGEDRHGRKWLKPMVESDSDEEEGDFPDLFGADTSASVPKNNDSGDEEEEEDEDEDMGQQHPAFDLEAIMNAVKAQTEARKHANSKQA